jgi:hypothetical protein
MVSVAKSGICRTHKASPEARLSLHYRCTLRIYCLEIGCHLEPPFQSLNNFLSENNRLYYKLVQRHRD